MTKKQLKRQKIADLISGCCTHYNTDKYKFGYIMAKPFKVAYCENCGEVRMIYNNFWGWIFETFFARFWTGKVFLEDKSYSLQEWVQGETK